MSTVDATTVARRFIELCENPAEAGMTQMKLLKLVYIAHGWMLGIHGAPLIQNRIEAWRYGPVIPSLRKRIKHFKGNPVTEIEGGARTDLTAKQERLIKRVHDVYGDWTALQLSSATHKDLTPWYTIWHIHQATEGDEIPDHVIQNYYRRLARNE